MNQNYQADPLVHNYLAPSYPIFIQIKYLINGLNAKKALKNAKSDILQVLHPSFSSLPISDLKVNASLWPLSSKPFNFESLNRNPRLALECLS